VRRGRVEEVRKPKFGIRKLRSLSFDIVTMEHKKLPFEIVFVEYKGLSSEIVIVKEIEMGIFKTLTVKRDRIGNYFLFIGIFIFKKIIFKL